MRDSGAASYSSNSHRPRSAALARNRSSAGRRTTACLRRHAGGDAHVPCVVAMDGRNHPEQRFPGLVGVAGSVACVGGVVTVASVLPARCALMTNPRISEHPD